MVVDPAEASSTMSLALQSKNAFSLEAVVGKEVTKQGRVETGYRER